MTTPTADLEADILAERLHQLLVGEEDARACRDLDDDACRVVPGNFTRMLLANVFAKVGDVAFNARSVLPWLALSVGAPAWIAAWLMPLRESLSMLPQLLLGAWIRRLPRRRGVYAFGAAAQAVSALAAVGVALGLTGITAGVALLGCVVVFSLARALCSLSQKDVLGKTVPKGQRGRLTGWAASCGGAAAMIAGLALAIEPEGRLTVVVMLLVAGLCWIAASGVYLHIVERPGETDGGANGFVLALAQLRTLGRDLRFVRFLCARGLLLGSALMAPWLVLLAGSGDANALAGFVVAEGIAGLVSTPVWGSLADRSAAAAMTIGGAVAAAVAVIVVAAGSLWPAALPAVCVLGFLLLAIGHAGVRMGRKTWIVDHVDGNERTARVALANTLTGLLLLGTGALGLIASVWSALALVAVLGVSAAFGAVLALTLAWEREAG